MLFTYINHDSFSFPTTDSLSLFFLSFFSLSSLLSLFLHNLFFDIYCIHHLFIFNLFSSLSFSFSSIFFFVIIFFLLFLSLISQSSQISLSLALLLIQSFPTQVPERWALRSYCVWIPLLTSSDWASNRSQISCTFPCW